MRTENIEKIRKNPAEERTICRKRREKASAEVQSTRRCEEQGRGVPACGVASTTPCLSCTAPGWLNCPASGKPGQPFQGCRPPPEKGVYNGQFTVDSGRKGGPKNLKVACGVGRYNGRMTQRTQELLQKALALTEEERAELAGSLMESLDSTMDADAESAWQREIAQRLAELDSGKAKTTGWREVQSQLTARLQHGLKRG